MPDPLRRDKHHLAATSPLGALGTSFTTGLRMECTLDGPTKSVSIVHPSSAVCRRSTRLTRICPTPTSSTWRRTFYQLRASTPATEGGYIASVMRVVLLVGLIVQVKTKSLPTFYGSGAGFRSPILRRSWTEQPYTSPPRQPWPAWAVASMRRASPLCCVHPRAC